MNTSSSFEGAPRLDRFEIREKIGEGAMGLVFRALDREIDRDVAIKTLRRSSPDDLLTLKREFRSLADIRHPHLVEMMELFADGETCFITMEWIEGCEFGDFARPRSAGPDSPRVRAPFETIRSGVRQLLSGLERLHGAGKLHQDVKPSNVMVDLTGRVVLLDFGLVHAFGIDRPSWRQSRQVAGTFDYMAPEQAWGHRGGPASDLYAVGAMLYEVLTGRLPYSGAQLLSMLSGRADPLPAPGALDASVPDDLSDLALQLLDLEPAARPTLAATLQRLEAHSFATPGGHTGTDSGGASSVDASASPFVGRDRELGRLRRAFERSREGPAVAVRIAGVSGIGKSRLVRRFLDELEQSDDEETRPLVLRSRCRPEESVRFKSVDGLVDDLSRFLQARPDEVTAGLDVPALARVFPVLAGARLKSLEGLAPLAGAEPHTVRTRAFQTLRALLRVVSLSRPLVLWIDDLQWGDTDSLPLLDELLREPGAPRMLLLVSYRGGERGPVLTAVEDQRGTWGRSESIVLGPLHERDGRALVEALLANRRPELAQAAHRIPSDAGGSPFFIGELSRLLLQTDPQRMQGADAPSLLADVVGRRVQRLSPASRRLLEVVAVAGAPIDRSVALRAAELADSDRGLVKGLRLESLIREGAGERTVDVETYHDHIREQVLAGVAGDRLVHLHASLLAEFEVEAVVPPARLLVHAQGCGRLDKVSTYAEQAGDQASESLAFGQAARFYREAINASALGGASAPSDASARGEADAARRASLHARCAEALVNAGRGLEAADAYLAAAQLGAGTQALEWRAQATEQLLVSGSIERGLALLEPLLSEYGVRFPGSERQAIAWTLALVARLALRGTRYTRRQETELDARERMRIDLCHSASKGLVAVDPARGGYLALRSLLFALRAGEPRRIGRGLSLVGGAVLVPAGGPLLRWGRRLVAGTEALARELDDDYLRGIVDMTRGQIAVFEGDWRTAVELGNRAIETLTLRCRGVTWEANTGHQAALRGLEELGRYDQLLLRSRLHALRSAERGDLYGQMISAGYLAIGLIADGRTAEARSQHLQALRRFHHGRFDVQSLYVVRADVMADVYDGHARHGCRKLEAAWPEIEQAMLLRVPVTRIDSLLLRARVAVQCASGGDGTPDADTERYVASARRDAKRLEREGRADTNAHAAAVRAALARRQGDAASMHTHLDRAEALYAAEGMSAQARCMQLARGMADGAGWNDALAAELAGHGLRDPRAWFEVVAPGFG